MNSDERIATDFGTPAYVYDVDEVDAAQRQLIGYLPERFELFYALKANPLPDLVRTLSGGCRAEISSTGELDAALRAGFAGGDCLYTGPGKTPGELDVAIARGVRLFSTDSPSDLRHVGAAAVAHGAEVDCLLRINSATASASTSIRMTGAPSQFGFDAETLPDLLPDVLAVTGTRVVGCHFFPLSNARDEASLIAEFQHTIAVAAELAEIGVPVTYLDIGGGFAVPYAVPGPRGTYPNLRPALEAALDASFPGWRAGEPRIACESGRFLVGASGTLLSRVTNIKVSRGRKFVILDGGINVFGGLSGLGRLLPVAVRLDGARATDTASLVGPLCTPGDILGRDIRLPDLSVGDLVRIPNAGAYGPTASLLAFLGRPAPVEAVVRGGEIVSTSRLDYGRVAV